MSGNVLQTKRLRFVAVPLVRDAPTSTAPDATWQPVTHDAKVIWFPWAFVMHDNHRLIPAKGRKGLIASAEYRDKKGDAAALAKLQWGPSPKLTGDVHLVARCYFPDRRKRDAGNYRKLITDALTGTVYADDAQLSCETWRRAGIVPKADARIEVLVYVVSALRQSNAETVDQKAIEGRWLDWNGFVARIRIEPSIELACSGLTRSARVRVTRIPE